jgi:hypothetical protein
VLWTARPNRNIKRLSQLFELRQPVFGLFQ